MRIFSQRPGQPPQGDVPQLRRTDKNSLTLNSDSTSLHSGRAASNQVEQRCTTSQRNGSDSVPANAGLRFAHDFSRIPVHASALEMGRDKQEAVEPGGSATAEAAEINAEAFASPQLTKKTVYGPVSGPCGNFKWFIQWELDKVTTKGGLVVQKAMAKFDVKDCKGNPYVVPKEYFDPNWFPFWEAWEIKKNQKVTNYAGFDDSYKWPAALTSTKGEYTATASAKFYDGVLLSNTNLKVTNKPPALELPMSKTDPKLPGGSNSVAHNLKATWDCCVQGQSKTGNTVVEHE